MLKSFRRRPADPAAGLREALGGYTLPTFPHVITSAIELLSSPDVNLGEVGDLLSRDPGITARLLRLANSTTFAPRRPITSARHAVTMLGRNEVEGLLIALGVQQSLPAQPVGRFDPKDFWLVSSRRAVMAASIAGLVDPSARAESFTAALLQDMALPVLAQQAAAYPKVLDAVHNSGQDLLTVECERYGWHHGVVGGWMCATWDFPQNLTDLIINHHDLEPQTRDLPIARAVSLISPVGELARLEQTVEVIRAAYGIGPDEVLALLETSGREAGEVAALFN